jgi:hypothetical protein
MFHAGTGLLAEIAIAPLRTHDLSQIGSVHPMIRPGDLLLGDLVTSTDRNGTTHNYA